jgi:DUF4097 and DUF4098 domain-containing protein YvlB
VAKIDTTISFSPDGTVELSLIAGTMKVSTWDRNQIRVVATATEPSLQFDASSSHMSLEQVQRHRDGSREDRTGSARYDVTVPAGSRASLSAVAGDIDASGLRGRMEVSNVSGSITVRGAGSSVNAEGVSGRITIANVGGDVHAENVSGDVSITGVTGSATAETVSGTTTLSEVRGERVHATSVSGNVDFAGTVNPSARYELETHSGDARLRLASNTSATISVETFSGSVSNDYPGAVRRRNSDEDDDSTSYEYRLGGGQARIHVETFSGTVHISQGKP